ncbi:MAG: CdvA-like protein [Desulfurococcales archaeon]|jgi:chromosome segregation ATPase|nr:CdvA-like protein [Desulfurococcales archaeon]MCC6062093.1 CdvA-like protein [Desulfurococcales archaeon]
MVSIEEVEKYLGSKITDPYGRVVGVLSSIYSDVDGNVSGVEVVSEDYSIKYVGSERLVISHDGLIILPEWKVEALKVEAQLDRARKRARAIEDLYLNKEISSQAYEEMKKQIEATLSRLKEKAKQVRSVLRKRLGEVEDEILHVDKAMNHLKLVYTSGEISEQRFKQSIDMLRSSKNKFIEEKKDLEKHIELIEKLETEISAPVKQPQITTISPQPVQQPQTAQSQTQQSPINVIITA